MTRKIDQKSDTKLLAVSLAFPPLAYPRSIQVSRLLRFSRIKTALFCAEESSVRKDPTIEPDSHQYLEKFVRISADKSSSERFIDRLTHRFAKQIWHKQNSSPDKYFRWQQKISAAIGSYLETTRDRPDVIVTFAQPFSCHLVGLRIKQKYGLPWIAHFSDPWTDNPFHSYDQQAFAINLELERKVAESADILAFTSVETIDQFFRKYPPKLREKARIMPQCFDPDLFNNTGERVDPTDEIVVRYLGNFYGDRTPIPLFQAIHRLLQTNPETLTGVRFELVGINDIESLEKFAGFDQIADLISIRPSVHYRESLRLMSVSDGLLIIDAPAEISVFLPSKLIDYIGSGKPVFGITPPGTAADLIRELGGAAIAPNNPDLIAGALAEFIGELRSRKLANVSWGNNSVRNRFRADQIAAEFDEIVKNLTIRNVESD